MVHAQIEQRVEAAAELVWDCYVGGRAEDLVVGVFAERLETDGSGVGTVRTTYLRDDAGFIRERIELFDEENLTCAYVLLDAGPLPYATYQGKFRIERDGPDACIIHHQSEFTPIGMTDAEGTAFYKEFNLAGIDKIRELLAAS